MERIGATCVFVVAAFALTAQAVKVLRPQVTASDFWNDENILNHTLTMDNQHASINLTLDVLESITELYFHINVTMSEGTKSSMSMWFSMSLCQILAVQDKVPMLQTFFENLEAYGNIFHQCPIQRGSYNLSNLWFTEEPYTSKEEESENSFEIYFNATAILPNTHRYPVIRDTIKGKAVIIEVDTLRNPRTASTDETNISSDKSASTET